MASGTRALELFERLEPRVVLSHSTLETALFYPEGFASARTAEVVTLQNSAGEATRFELHARYARGEPEGELLASGTLAPSERRRIVVTPGGTLAGALPRPFTPYALEVRADGDIGAALTRSDFGATAVEPFANGAALLWSFPTVVRDADRARDFITVYNPGEDAATVRLEVLGETGVVAVVEREIEGEQRGGFAINGIEGIPEGRFGARLIATEPVVGAVSHFDLVNDRAVMNLGTPLAGAGVGSVTTGAFVDTGLVDFDEALTGQTTLGIVNPTAAAGRVDLTVVAGTGAAGTERTIDRSVIVRPGTRVEVSAADLGLLTGEGITSARFASTLPVAVGGEAFAARPELVPGGEVVGDTGTVVFPTPAADPGFGTVGGTAFGPGFGTGTGGFGFGVSPGLGFGGVLDSGFAGTGIGGAAGFGGTAGTGGLLLTDPLGTAGLGTTGFGTTGFGTTGLGTSGFGTAGLGSTVIADGSLLGRTGGSLLGRTGDSLLGRTSVPLGFTGTTGALGTSGLGTAAGGATLTGTNLGGTLGGTTLAGTGDFVTVGGTTAPVGSLLLRE